MNAPNTVSLLPIKETLRIAYEKTAGSKKSILAAFGIILFLGLAMGVFSGILQDSVPILSSFINIIGRFIVIILQAGLLYLGILRGRGVVIQCTQIFRAFEMRIALNLLGVYLIQFLIFTSLLLIFVFLPAFLYGHYGETALQPNLVMKTAWIVWVGLGAILLFFLILRMMFARGLVIDQKLRSWRATRVSFQLTQGNVLRLLALTCCQVIALLLGVLLLVVGLIWAIPFAVMVYGVAYNTLLSSANLNIRTASSI